MGCWNKTCGISNLPIMVGDRVYVFLLEENKRFDRCYSTAFWKPLLFPFQCEYDDYGGGRDVDSNFALILKSLKEVTVDIPRGENEYHDFAVNSDILDENLFFDSVRQGRLYIKDYYQESSRIDYVMIRADVVAYLTQNWKQQEYVGVGNGTSGWSNAYTEYSFKDIIDAIPEYIEAIKASKYTWSVRANAPENRVGKYLDLSIDNQRKCNVFRVYEEIFDRVKSGEVSVAAELLENFMLGIHLHRFIESVRRSWAPGSHEGSQAGFEDSYIVLTSMINEVFTGAIAEFSNSDEEE